MSKLFIEEATLTAIGNAIRGKEGSTELVPVNDMATRITNLPSGGGSEIDVPEMVLTGDCTYACSGALANTCIEVFPHKISTKDITNSNHMFSDYTGISVPFELNFASSGQISNTSYMFLESNIEVSPQIDYKNPSTYFDTNGVFSSCRKLKTLNPVLNCYPSNMNSYFSLNTELQSIPDDFFSTWNFSRMRTHKYANASEMFNGCFALRKIPSSFFDWWADGEIIATGTYSPYKNMTTNCYSLDELVGIPVVTGVEYTSNSFSNLSTMCRLSRYVFRTNEDGTPIVARWKSQTLTLDLNIGHASGYSTGIKIGEDKRVKDDATYQALKNDPDWWTTDIAYSRYNHDSAVETINSLPDTSAYGTNTIKFKGASGSATDGGAINTLTAEEIAVATAKGWTVSLS